MSVISHLRPGLRHGSCRMIDQWLWSPTTAEWISILSQQPTGEIDKIKALHIGWPLTTQPQQQRRLRTLLVQCRKLAWTIDSTHRDNPLLSFIKSKNVKKRVGRPRLTWPLHSTSPGLIRAGIRRIGRRQKNKDSRRRRSVTLLLPSPPYPIPSASLPKSNHECS
jgi:hypothetical protein